MNLLAESLSATWLSQLRGLFYEPLERLRKSGYALAPLVTVSSVDVPTRVSTGTLKSIILWPRADLENTAIAWSNLAKDKFIFQPPSPIGDVLAIGRRTEAYASPVVAWNSIEPSLGPGQSPTVGRMLRITEAFINQVDPPREGRLWLLPIVAVFALSALWFQQKHE